MANRNFDASYCIGKRLVDISGSFVPLTGAGTVVASTVKGQGFGYAPVNGVMTLQAAARPGITSTPGIIRVSTGLYTITLDDSYLDIQEFCGDLAVPNTGSGTWIQPVEPVSQLATAGKAPVLSILLVNSSGTPTDAPASSRVYFYACMRDSSVQFQKP
jgi:hypothetical protein